jgi:hypothetical protein
LEGSRLSGAVGGRRAMRPSRNGPGASLPIVLALLMVAGGFPWFPPTATTLSFHSPTISGTTTAVENFTAAVGRLVALAAAAGGGLLSLVWARVALSWFSHDSMKKVLAKERARDALIGTLLFVAAVSGLTWALANWVVTGT